MMPEEHNDLFTFGEFSHDEAEKTAYSDYSYWKTTFRTFRKNYIGLAAFIIMITFSLFAFIQPYLPNQQSIDHSEYLAQFDMWRSPPSAKHWFGTDELGRDLWARVWEGTRISISLAFLVAATEVLIGLVAGTLWGYLKRLDRLMTEIYNTLHNIPNTVLLLLLSYILSPGYWTLFIAMVSTGWIGMARYIRNQVLLIRDREYNMASRCLGTPLHRIMSKNLIPHLISVIIMRLAVAIPVVIASEVVISYLGLGLPATSPSLGVLISAGRTVYSYRPHMLIFPAIMVSIVTISFYIAGNAFADASDPKNRG